MRFDKIIVRVRAGLAFAMLLLVCASATGAPTSVVPLSTPATATMRSPTWGLHGMLLFGGADGLFASHLPMFHAPHDYHVVIALQLPSEIDDAMRTRLSKAPALWTLVPEKFELARLAPGAARPLMEFKADIVEGHFERGGKTVYSGVVVRVIRTERFIQLDPDARPGTTAQYLPIGQGRTWFLVKEVHARPDFDHVVMLSSVHSPAAISVPVSGIARPTNETIKALLPAGTNVIGSVYYDTDDLQ